MSSLSAERVYAGVAVPLATLSGWLLQADTGTDVDVDLLFGNLLVGAVGGALTTLIVGGLLLAITTEYADRNTRRILREPGRTFAYGFAIFLAFIVGFVALALTIVGLLVAIPLAFVFAFAFLIWGQLGYLAVGRALTDAKWEALAVAVGFAFLVGVVPVAGALAGFVVGAMGVGAGVMDFREDNPRFGPQTRRGPGPRGNERGGGRRGGARGGRSGQSGPQNGRRNRDQHERGGWGADDAGGGWGTDNTADDGWETENEDEGWGTESGDDGWGTTDDENWSGDDDDQYWDDDEDGSRWG